MTRMDLIVSVLCFFKYLNLYYYSKLKFKHGNACKFKMHPQTKKNPLSNNNVEKSFYD